MALDPQARAEFVAQLADIQRRVTQAWLANVLRPAQETTPGGVSAEEAIAISLDAFGRNVQAVKGAEAAMREKGLIA